MATHAMFRLETGRIGVSTLLAIVGGVILFGVMAAIGYASSAPEDQPPVIEAAEYVPEIVDVDDSVDESSTAVIADEIVRTVRDSGAATEEQVQQVSEAVGSAGGGGATRTVIEVSSDDISELEEVGTAEDGDADTPPADEPVPEDEPMPVPDEVLDEEGYIRHFIDWDRIRIFEPPFNVRFDLCAGAVPGLPALPGCPDGTGATIVPLDDPYDGPALEGAYRIDAYGPYGWDQVFAADCNADDDVYRIMITSNRPSSLEVSAWNVRGSGATATPVTFFVPPDLAAFAAWETAVASEPDITPRIQQCVEVPGVTFGRVAFRVEGTSLYVPDDGATDVSEGSSSFFSITGGRPPSGLVAMTPTTLYVRAWNQSSLAEQIFVQARPQSSEGCDNLGDLALVGSGPGSVQAVQDRVIPMDADQTGWPFGRTWDELEIHRLTLEPGVPYDVCIFWVVDSGPSFDPSSIVRTETAQVVPPSPNALEMSVGGASFVDLGGDPRVNVVSVVGIVSGPASFDPDNPTDACRASWDANSAAGTINIPVEDGGILCTTTNTTSLILQGGMRVTVSAVDSLGDRYQRTSWVRLGRNLFRCGTDCGEQRLLVEVPMPWVPSRSVTGSFEWPFDLDDDVIVPIDEDAQGETGPPVGSVHLEYRFIPTGAESRRWMLSDIGEQDQSAGSLPVRPQIDVTTSHPRLPGLSQNQDGVYFPDGFPGLPHGVVTVRIEADRPVSYSAIVTEYEDRGVCLRPGVAEPRFESMELRTVHFFQIDGLCLGELYNVNVTVQDETGTTAEIFGVGTADGTTPVLFGSQFLRLEVRGEVEINPAAFGPGTPGSRLHVQMENVYVQDPSGRRRFPETKVQPTRSLSAEEVDTGWNFDDPYRGIICANPDNNGGVLEPMTLQAFPRQPGSIGEEGYLTFRVRRWTAPTRDDLTINGLLYRCSSVASSATLYETSELIPIDQLLAGVTFTSADGLYSVTIHGWPRAG